MAAGGPLATRLACEQAGVAPDCRCLSRGRTGGAIPLAVSLCAEPIFAAQLSTDRARLFYHSSSYTANPIACAAANANLAIWDEEPVQARIDALAEAQAAHLSLLAGHPRVVNPRRLGTIAALDVAAPDSGYL